MPGPVVALCLGRRCTSTGAAAAGSGLSAAVRETRGAVLVTTACLGPCGLASVAAVAHRDGSGGCSGPTVWLAGVHEEERAAALAAWVREGGPGASGEPDAGMPATLVPAAAGLGVPMRFGA
ncbi:hypothetical protein E9549_09430 [Blastococcus sp. MG754426]|uniref:hypothetical protein n=1 Tax=unclassified Blastococcus TaxID=2619396 RepID=UPI001EF05A9D|nr:MULTISPECIES: hypothetical protein [unclassified Blastococcus]MCF6507625.1 hypothetical protein [Blastococcus sp. MG754426]MCF6512732.1 hypothetical protein [Blastococcus sp. MG754427]MCF6737551.1 hypothetical protein [Blastococcus sp. KM273129]